jgi:hypothetical protein
MTAATFLNKLSHILFSENVTLVVFTSAGADQDSSNINLAHSEDNITRS